MTQPAHRTPRIERDDRPPAPRSPDSERSGPKVAPKGRSALRTVIFVIIGLVAVGLVVRWVMTKDKKPAGAAGGESAEARPTAVTLAPVAVRDVPVYLEGLGNALPLATVTVKSQVDGRLDKILFQEGQHVKAGDVIAQIDPRPFQIQLHQAQAALARDSSSLANAKLNLDRYTQLRAQSLVAQQQVDDQRATADQGEASVKADQAQIENAKLQLDYARIRSPIDGVTGVRLVDQGNLVHAADTTGIVVVTQLDPMSVLFTLPQDNLDEVGKAMQAGAVSVEAYSRDGGTKLSTGQLLVIDNQVNQATATVRLKATFANPDNALWPNEFVKVRLLLRTLKGATVVPAAAVQRGPQGTFVYVVGPDQVANVRQVEVNSVDSQTAVVTKGVTSGEQVVVEGQNQLRPGAKVQGRAPQGAGSAAPASSASGGPPGQKRQRKSDGASPPTP
jgi:multidrug efflux system membrane fusion protein